MSQRSLSSELRRKRRLYRLSKAQVAVIAGVTPKTVARWETGLGRIRAGLDALTAWNEEVRARDAAIRSRSRYRFVDLFAGIGGFRNAFEAEGGECVFTCEWDTYAQTTYKANFEVSHAIGGDIEAIPPELIPAHDVLLAGFPCQPFSIAGVSKKNALGRPHGFACEAQGTLFFSLARILEHHRPQAFLLENVKNLRSHDGGRTFDVIMKVLTDDLGYSVSHRIIDARRFVPQHRERVFIVGFREDVGFDIGSLRLPDPEHGPRLRSILHPEDGTELAEERFTDANGAVLPKYTLSDKLWSYLQAYAERHRRQGNGFGFGLVGPDDVARTLSARYYKDGSEILIRQEKKNPRRLTPRECARLMGFDRPGGASFRIPVSDTRAYKQFGNAVVVPVVRAVAAAMQPYLLHEPRPQLELELAGIPAA